MCTLTCWLRRCILRQVFHVCASSLHEKSFRDARRRRRRRRHRRIENNNRRI